MHGHFRRAAKPGCGSALGRLTNRGEQKEAASIRREDRLGWRARSTAGQLASRRRLPLSIAFLLQDSGVGEECFHNNWLFYADTIASDCAVRKAWSLQAGKTTAAGKPRKAQRVAIWIEHECRKAGRHRTNRGRLAGTVAEARADAPKLFARFGPGGGLIFRHRLKVGRLPTGGAAPCCSPRRCSTYVPTRSDNLRCE